MCVIGALAGPQEFAGKDCNPNAFHISFENEDWDDALGTYMTDRGREVGLFHGRRLSGGLGEDRRRDALYKGKAFGRSIRPAAQLDFAAELAQLRAADPDAVFVFYPGGSRHLLRQAIRASRPARERSRSIPRTRLSSELNFAAEGDTALGHHPEHELDARSRQSRQQEIRRRFHEEIWPRGRPSSRPCNMTRSSSIDSAVAAVHGKIEDKDAFRAALRKADFHSVRGPFKFDNNQYPIQNIYITEVEKDPTASSSSRLQRHRRRELARPLSRPMPDEMVRGYIGRCGAAFSNSSSCGA